MWIQKIAVSTNINLNTPLYQWLCHTRVLYHNSIVITLLPFLGHGYECIQHMFGPIYILLVLSGGYLKIYNTCVLDLDAWS